MKNKPIKLQNKLSFVALIIISLFFFLNSNLYINKAIAQTISGIIINLEPNYPIPGSIVKLKMETYQFDTDTANITWYYNNKKIDSGVGKKEIEIKYPDLGITADIRVVATANNLTNYVAGKKLGGSTINLVYEPLDSYTPIWYRGPAETAEGGKVKLFAEAYLYNNGKRIDSDNLIYNWTINEEPMPSMSGLGKSTSIINIDPILGEAFVQLVVKSIDGIYENKTSLRVIANKPNLKVYYNDNSVFPKYLDYSLKMNKNEITLFAEAFNSLVDNGGNYFWTINGVPSVVRDKFMAVRKESGSVGTVNLNILYENKNKLFQSAEFKGIIDYK